jgi:DNA-binding NarL/FixJ family response regulator
MNSLIPTQTSSSGNDHKKKFFPQVSIVDDDQDFIQFLTDLGNSADFQVLDCFSTAAEALRRLPENCPDLVLMDINLPGMSGIECTKALRIALPEVPILVFTGYPDAPAFLRSIMAGARGFLVKPFTNPELLCAIHEVLGGEFSIAKPAIPFLIQFIQQLKQFSNPGALTEREEEVLACVLLGLQQKEIATKLKIGEATVHTYMQRIHEKLGVHSKREIITRYLKPI